MRQLSEASPLACTALPDGLDAATLAYVEATRLPFEQLRQAAGQLAGVLVLAVARGQGAAGHSLLDLADTARAEATDALRSCRPPPRGAHHHRHLEAAAQAVATALTAARLFRRGGDAAATDAVMAPLRAAWRELQWAAGALPGFELVAFAQGCCVQHRRTSQQTEQP